MENREKEQRLLDVNGKEIKIGSFGRLSEEGRRQSLQQIPKMLKESANLRFKVIEIDIGSQKLLAELTEIDTPFKVVLSPEFIVIEKK